MRLHLHLHPHPKRQPRHPDPRQQRLVPRAVLPQTPHQSLRDLGVQWHAVSSHLVHLRPPGPAGVAQRALDVGERLVRLSGDVGRDGFRGGVPAAFLPLVFRLSLGLSGGRDEKKQKKNGLLTLAGALDLVADADGLAVVRVPLDALAEAFVGEVLEVGHGSIS